jgi:hypothetical protein
MLVCDFGNIKKSLGAIVFIIDSRVIPLYMLFHEEARQSRRNHHRRKTMNDIQMTEDQIAEIAAEMDTDMESVATDTTESEAEATDTTEAEATGKRGGKNPTFSDNQKVADALNAIDAADGEYHYKTGSVSRVLTLQLVEMGLVEAVDKPRETRGRPMKVYRLTARGNALVELAAGANAEQEEQEEQETENTAEMA